MKSADKRKVKRTPRTWLCTFWSTGAINRRTQILSKLVHAHSRAEALRMVEGAAPKGTARITVASPLHYQRNIPGRVSLTEQLALAPDGAVFWVQGTPPSWAGARAGRRCEYMVFYAFPFAQARTGDDVSACERVRLTRITVLGKMEVRNGGEEERSETSEGERDGRGEAAPRPAADAGD